MTAAEEQGAILMGLAPEPKRRSPGPYLPERMRSPLAVCEQIYHNAINDMRHENEEDDANRQYRGDHTHGNHQILFVNVGHTVGGTVMHTLLEHESEMREEFKGGAQDVHNYPFDIVYMHPVAARVLEAAPNILITTRDPVERFIAAYNSAACMKDGYDRHLCERSSEGSDIKKLDTRRFMPAQNTVAPLLSCYPNITAFARGLANKHSECQTARNVLDKPWGLSGEKMGMCFHLGGMLSRLKCRPSVYVVHTEDSEEEIMGIPEWLGLEMRFNETIKAGGGSFPHSEDRPTPEGYKMLKKYLEHEYKFLEVLENEMGDNDQDEEVIEIESGDESAKDKSGPNVTITVTNSASISVPADYFGPGKEAGPNAVDAFIAAATAVGVGPMDVQVVGDPAAKKYAEEHLPQLQRKLQRNNAAVHVPKVEAAAMTKPLGHVYRESKTLPAEDAERLHWNVNESVKESGMGVRAPAKPAIRASVAHKEREHQKEQETAKAGSQAGSQGAAKAGRQEAPKAGRQEAELAHRPFSTGPFNTALRRSDTTATDTGMKEAKEAKEATEATEAKEAKAATAEKKLSWAETINQRSELEREREEQLASLTAAAEAAGQLEPPTEGI